MFTKIMVPLDGSANSERITCWATGLAKCLGAEILLLAVVDPDEVNLPDGLPDAPRIRRGPHGPYDAPAPAAGTDRTMGAGAQVSVLGAEAPEAPAERPPAHGTQVIDHAVELAEAYLEGQAEEVEVLGVKARTAVVIGQPAEEIVHTARNQRVDMIAMATRRESALARGVLGSVTDRVLHSTSIPVLTVRPEDASAFAGNSGAPSVVIVPLDGSDYSERAIGPALEIAEAASADVIFLRSVRFPYYGVAGPDLQYYAGEYGISEQRREALGYLSTFVKQASARGLAARAHAVVGNPAPRIIEQAGSNEGALVVMSTHGAGGLKRWVVGSVADKVVRSSGRPVLVIPPVPGV